MSTSEQIQTAAISRSGEEKSKGLQSTKDLNIKQKEREFYKNKKDKTGHHFKLGQELKSNEKMQPQLNLNENPESLIGKIEHKLSDTLGAAKDSI